MSNTLVTATQNYLSPQRFAFQIDTPELIELSYECQQISIPTITVPQVDVPFRQFNTKFSGSSIEFDNFEARFIIDENMENYKAIYDWLVYQVTDNESERSKHKDVILLIFNNNNQSNIRIHMINAMPVSLSPVEFDTTKTNTEYLYADVSFAIDYYEIRNLRT
jgi:hypothetical protein